MSLDKYQHNVRGKSNTKGILLLRQCKRRHFRSITLDTSSTAFPMLLDDTIMNRKLNANRMVASLTQVKGWSKRDASLATFPFFSRIILTIRRNSYNVYKRSLLRLLFADTHSYDIYVAVIPKRHRLATRTYAGSGTWDRKKERKKKGARIRINRPLQRATHARISYVWTNGGRTQS